MAIVLNNPPESEQFKVLLIGNNPIELSSIYERLIMLKDKKFIAETAFDLKSALKSTITFNPAFILIDDNIGKKQMREIVGAFAHLKNSEHIPITILKNSNAGDSAEGVQEFILKQHADGESIAKALFNSVRLKRTQEFIAQTFLKNKRKLKRAIKSFR